MNHYSPRFGQKTTFRQMNDTDAMVHTNFYHPYAFIGIPGLAPGRAMEMLRPNIGFHLARGNFPSAELRVRLRFQPLVSQYTFDTYQYITHNHFKDQYDYITKAKDKSLYSSYPFLAARNMTTYDHWKTAIYLVLNRLGESPVFFAKENFTKVDQMYFPTYQYPLKIDQIGRLIKGRNLTWVHDKEYYYFVQNFTLSDEEDRDCLPPYNNYTNPYCWDLSKYN